MKCEYVYKKKNFAVNGIDQAQFFFANGDYFTLTHDELAEADVKFYDKLSAINMGFCPFACGGYIQCKIQEKKTKRDSHLLYRCDAYGKTVNEYIKNRCLSEGDIRYIRLFNKNHWSFGFYCVATVRLQDDFLMFEFQNVSSHGAFDGKYHTVRARNVTVGTVEKIDLDFENCDGIEIFQEEIQDIQLEFEKELMWSGSSLSRQIKQGFIRLRFDDSVAWRKATINGSERKNTIKKLEKRICGKGKDVIDICHLYVTYNHAGYGLNQTECVEIKNICSINERKCDDFYVSGHAQRENDGSILIVFGK